MENLSTRQRVAALRQQGLSYRQIAERVGVSKERVGQIVRSQRAESSQGGPLDLSGPAAVLDWRNDELTLEIQSLAEALEGFGDMTWEERAETVRKGMATALALRGQDASNEAGQLAGIVGSAWAGVTPEMAAWVWRLEDVRRPAPQGWLTRKLERKLGDLVSEMEPLFGQPCPDWRFKELSVRLREMAYEFTDAGGKGEGRRLFELYGHIHRSREVVDQSHVRLSVDEERWKWLRELPEKARATRGIDRPSHDRDLSD